MGNFNSFDALMATICLCASLLAASLIVSYALHAETAALQQIADSANAIADKPQPAPQPNAECHETLGLFDEWLAHDLKTGGSGRKLK